MVRRISLVLFLLVVMLFLLPWVSVTCAGQEILQLSGLELVAGTEYDIMGETGRYDGELLAIITLVIAVLGIVSFFIKNRLGRISRGVLAVLGMIFLFSLKFKLDGDIKTEGEGILQTSYLAGFWLTFVSFFAVAVTNIVNFTQLRKQSESTDKTNLLSQR